MSIHVAHSRKRPLKRWHFNPVTSPTVDNVVPVYCSIVCRCRGKQESYFSEWCLKSPQKRTTSNNTKTLRRTFYTPWLSWLPLLLHWTSASCGAADVMSTVDTSSWRRETECGPTSQVRSLGQWRHKMSGGRAVCTGSRPTPEVRSYRRPPSRDATSQAASG